MTPWEDEQGIWRAIVYSGEPYDRQRRCTGAFTDPPTLEDVARLLQVIAPLKKREVARRTPVSEPMPRFRPVYSPPILRRENMTVGYNASVHART